MRAPSPRPTDLVNLVEGMGLIVLNSHVGLIVGIRSSRISNFDGKGVNFPNWREAICGAALILHRMNYKIYYRRVICGGFAWKERHTI